MTTSPPHKNALVLIDVENTIGAHATRPVAAARLTALLAHAPAQARVVAACAPERIRPEVATILTGRGVKILPTGTGPDAADTVLLNRARQAAAHGVTHFTVASADAAFAALATLGELHVLAWERQPVSAALAKAATVHRIPRNHHTPQPPPPGPVPDHPAPAVTAPPAPHTRTGQPAPPPNDPRPSWSTARRAATAAAVLFCAGFAFGAGTAIGNRLIHLTINAAPPPTHRKRQWPA